MNQALILNSLPNVSKFCRICTASNEVDCPIYELSNEHEGTTKLHTMLVKLFPTVFNESQVLSDKAMNWPSKICQDCKGKVMESYRFYEMCTKSVHQLTMLAASQPNITYTSQEKDDPLARIKMEVKNESEEPMAVKEEYDSDDQTLQCGGFESFSPTEDVLNNAEKSCSSNANELHLNPSMSTVEGLPDPSVSNPSARQIMHCLATRRNNLHKPIRRACHRCYSQTRIEMGRPMARINVKKSSTYCTGCPNQPQMCKSCFKVIHNTNIMFLINQ